MSLLQFVSQSAEETLELGRRLGEQLPDGAVICFYGDLAAGKTCFIKGLASAVTGCSVEEVHSPTFVYMHIYSGKREVYHFDLYRLQGPGEFIASGFDEYLSTPAIVCIEWAERLEDQLPTPRIEIWMEHCPQGRKIEIKGYDGRGF